MPIQILMPALSPTMTEGNLARWLKKEGDVVKPGQVIAEIETDKATMEVEAVDEGTIAKILVPAGAQGIKVNALIAVMAAEGEDVKAAAASAAAPPKMPETEKSPAQKQTDQQAAGAQTLAAPKHSEGGPPAGKDAPMQAAQTQQANGHRVFASPLARRVAEQSGIDLNAVTGSGPNGRIVRADVEAAGGSAKATGLATPKRSEGGPGIDARDLADKLGMPYEALPNSGVRKVIARRLLESKQTVPHFYLTVDCVIDELLELRKKLNAVEGVKVSVNDLVIRAVALGMRKVPASNASWTNEAILQYKNIDISVAVATPNGLITPIVKQADTKTPAVIAAEMKDLAARARDGKLKPEEFQGGGFSISNLGMFGVKDFQAIINPPQACILAVGAGEPRPIVRDGQIVAATVMSCTLSVDHRAVDGAVGAEFLQAFKALIEQPYSLVV